MFLKMFTLESELRKRATKNKLEKANTHNSRTDNTTDTPPNYQITYS